MRASIGCGVVLLSAMRIVTEAAAGNRGLSPIIDSGGDILAAAGGKITRGAHSLDIPAKGAKTFDESVQFLDDASAVLRALLDDKASLREQAFQAAQISNSLVMAARNGLQDANLAAHLNFILPSTTYKQMVEKYSKEFSGNAMYEEIIKDAESQLHRLSCFVAGTLVHTKEGLRPIEQIKVGDFVLSKPESGEGEASYKRVVRTFEKEGQEVYFVKCIINPENTDIRKRKYEYVVVTGNHPFWVERLEFDGEIKKVAAWVNADKFYELVEKTGLFPMFELQDGHLVQWANSGPVLRTETQELGIVYSYPDGEPFYEGVAVDFSKGYPTPVVDEEGVPKYIPIDIEPDDYVGGENSILSITGGYHPMLHKVYNLEVEDNHTYYVGAAGVLVHNTCAKEIEKLKNSKFSPAEALPIFPTEAGLKAEFKAQAGQSGTDHGFK